VIAPLTKTRPTQVSPPPEPASSLPLRFSRGTFFWLFGLSASILIGSLWGSAVTGSRNTVADVVDDLAAEQIAQDRFAEWITDGLRSVDVIVSDDATVAGRVLSMPETEQVVAELTDQLVDAAFAPAGTTAVVDPASALLPAVPAIARVLAEEGISAAESDVAGLVSSIEPIPLDDIGEFRVTSSASRAAAALSLAAALAAVAMISFGGAAVVISPDRVAALRNLAYRLMLTSLSLAVMLRLGSWIADPGGGATPLGAGVSTLLGSHTYVPLAMAAAAAVVGLRARRRSGSHRPKRSSAR
jgi:hypothetical protein